MSTKSSKKFRETSENQCLGCGKHDALFECTGCLDASFCRQDCQRKTWSTHRFDCLPCGICGERIPGTQVRRDCACKKGGFSHIACLVKEAVEDSGGEEWSFSSTQFKQCKICGEPYTGDTKQVLDGEHKARVEQAKERMQVLLEKCQEMNRQCRAEEIDCASSSVALARDCIEIYRGIYGKDDWTSGDFVYSATYYLGRALLLSNRPLEAAETLEVARVKIHKHKPHGWKHHLRSANMNLARAYTLLADYSSALPLYEMLFEKDCRFLDSHDRFCITKWLTECYFHTSSWKQARNMVKVARELSERFYGRDDQRTLDLIEMRVRIIGRSYNPAKSLGIEGISDGADLEIVCYCDSCFDVAVFSDAVHEEYEFSNEVPIEQVIMIPDSDVVLHSLKGARHLNGKLGVIETFNVELGRYVVIVEGSAKTVNVKPQNVLPAYMGCEKEEMIERAIELSQEEEEY